MYRNKKTNPHFCKDRKNLCRHSLPPTTWKVTISSTHQAPKCTHVPLRLRSDSKMMNKLSTVKSAHNCSVGEHKQPASRILRYSIYIIHIKMCTVYYQRNPDSPEGATQLTVDLQGNLLNHRTHPVRSGERTRVDNLSTKFLDCESEAETQLQSCAA